MPPPVLLAVLAEIAGVKALEATEFRVHFNFLPSSGGAYAIFFFLGGERAGGEHKDSISNFMASKCWAFRITCPQLGTKQKRPRVPRYRQGDDRPSTALRGPGVLVEGGGSVPPSCGGRGCRKQPNHHWVPCGLWKGKISQQAWRGAGSAQRKLPSLLHAPKGLARFTKPCMLIRPP